MSGHQILVIGRYEIAEKDIVDFQAAAVATARAARQIDGNIHYSFSIDLENPGLFHVVELWRDQSALDARLASEEFRETGRKVAQMTVLSRSVTHYAGATATIL
ncbi:hypothetical protein GCM10007897_04610 [Sphingobium jiangsuense]|uniref:Quinol monooxygenase YgiN n=1 Tax=Sphingobium jiangsuense TaxID=870476 RepID=A0A7W6BG58_9SPHN|nr:MULTISPECIES: antibiotic biosynthesis monooxygenase family protein [Sphingobium]MBB3926375.1 quinol monooxygenase YgiN [Sphingobium jiangsuense]QEH81010.1 antibiotic biosynthesis monooxygenase [Sphingomonas sp. C8-2]GLS99083.1 hypothetical protein GCM10007897_04610 [Sphingobium jiangsuense]SCW96265.1 Quinol monooxygenase YgiN [Sphingobium faniae]